MPRAEVPPFVSVIIPCFRGGPWLDEALHSVQQQTYPNWEVVLVDNGLREPLSSWIISDQRIRVISESHQGVSWARNAGISNARGEFVAFLDEDDRWHPNKLAEQIPLLLNNPSAALCLTSFSVINDEGEMLSGSISPPSTYEAVLRKGGGVLPSSVVARSDLVRLVGTFNTTYKVQDDLDFFLRLLHTGPAVVADLELTEYRWHSTNTSSLRYLDVHTEMRRVLRDARRLAVIERRWDRFLYSLRGEVVSRIGVSKVAFHYAKELVSREAPARDIARHVAIGMWRNPFAARGFVQVLRSRRGRIQSADPTHVTSSLE